MTIFMWIATLAWALLVAGATQYRVRSRHVPLVLSAIIIDFSLVLYLQFTRDAVQTALAFSLSPLQQIHIAFSSTALVLYIPVVVLGMKILSGNEAPEIRALHRKVAYAALASRTLGFLFMFSMWKGG